MKQAVDSAQVDEGSVVGDVLDRSLDRLPFLEGGERRLPLFVPGLLQQHPPRHHDIPPAVIDLDNFQGKRLAHQRVQITDRMQVDLRAWKERFDADIDHHPTFDA